MASVLVVDDDAASREYLRTLVTHGGHEVFEAADGETALRLVDEHRPDAVITDVLMPGLDGCELARMLRSRPGTAALPIAFNTAHYDRWEIQPMARACGVREVIYKPAAPITVLAVVDALLARTPAPVADGGRPDDFVDQHRQTLKAKLVQTAAALQATHARETRLRREVGHLQGLLAETQHLTWAGAWHLNPATGAVVLTRDVSDRLGLATPEVPRRQLWQRIHPDDRGRFAALALGVLRDGRPRTIRLRIGGAGGAVRELVVAVHAALLDGRRTLRGVAQDITGICRDQRLKVHAHALRQADRLMRDQLHAAMVPRDLPTVAAVDVAAVYLTAPGRTDTGADWYDTLPLPDGRILLSIGSVAGHRIPGPAVAGPMRAVLRAYAVEDPDPAPLLARLNRYLTAAGLDNTYVTVLAALYDPGTAELRLANAGHPVPLLITHDEGRPRVRKLVTPDPPLGIHTGVDFQAQRLELTSGTTLCAYTDGLTDDYAGAESGLARLIGAITRAMTLSRGPDGRPSAQHLLNQAIKALLSGDVRADDVCLFLLRAPG